ncbi:hypothetical protein SNK04_014145 [Fusarium graminearum]
MAVAKVAPAAGVTAGTYTPGYTLSDIALFCTILFTLLQAFSVVVKNWGEWTQWARALGNGSAGRKFGFAAAPAALVLALVAALGQNDPAHEGRRYTPYYDSAGILTACAGITGPAVVKGKRYTDEECTRLETAYVQTMLGHMGQCVRGDFQFHEIKAWGHFAYNVGTNAFCTSTAARRLNAGERAAACDEIWKWRYVKVNGAVQIATVIVLLSIVGGCYLKGRADEDMAAVNKSLRADVKATSTSVQISRDTADAVDLDTHETRERTVKAVEAINATAAYSDPDSTAHVLRMAREAHDRALRAACRVQRTSDCPEAASSSERR